MSDVLPPRIDGAAPEPVAGTSGHPKPAQRHTAPVRHCPNCLRYAPVDRVPEQRHQGITTTIPAYECCTYCGWVHGYIEETA